MSPSNSFVAAGRTVGQDGRDAHRDGDTLAHARVTVGVAHMEAKSVAPQDTGSSRDEMRYGMVADLRAPERRRARPLPEGTPELNACYRLSVYGCAV